MMTVVKKIARRLSGEMSFVTRNSMVQTTAIERQKITSCA